MNVRIRQVILGAVISGLLGSILVVAQQKSPWNREEWNDYQDAKSGATPADVVAGFDAFLQKHPDSALRVVFQNELVDALYKTQNRARVLEAVDGFLAVDKETFMAAGYTEVNYPITIYDQHRTYAFVTREMLVAGGKLTDEQMQGGVGHARSGLELLSEWANLQKQAGATAELIDPAAADHELMYHQVLATLTWRMKDYDGALPELSYLIEKYPDDANLSLQMGYSNLNKSEPDSLKSIWYLARAVALGHPQAESARGRVLREVVRHSGVAPSCMAEDIEAVYAQAGSQVHPPAGWNLVTSERINAARQDITYAGLFTALDADTDEAHVAWLAACGLPMGLGDDGSPTYEAVLLSFEEIEMEPAETAAGEQGDAAGEGGSSEGEAPAGEAKAPAAQKAVVLRVAATQQAVNSKTANLEVTVLGFSNLTKLREETNQTIKIGGTIASFAQGPFVLKLKEGKVDFLEAVFDEQ